MAGWTFQFTSNVDKYQEMVKQAKEAALEKMGGTAETHAKGYCPVDTGRLKGSITHEKKDENTMVVGTTVDYAPHVEYGHVQEVGRYVPAIGARLVSPFVPGTPFMRTAIESHVNEYKSICENEFNKIK